MDLILLNMLSCGILQIPHMASTPITVTTHILGLESRTRPTNFQRRDLQLVAETDA